MTNGYVTIGVSQKNYDILSDIRSKLTKEAGRLKTMNDALDLIIKNNQTQKESEGR